MAVQQVSQAAGCTHQCGRLIGCVLMAASNGCIQGNSRLHMLGVVTTADADLLEVQFVTARHHGARSCLDRLPHAGDSMQVGSST